MWIMQGAFWQASLHISFCWQSICFTNIWVWLWCGLQWNRIPQAETQRGKSEKPWENGRTWREQHSALLCLLMCVICVYSVSQLETHMPISTNGVVRSWRQDVYVFVYMLGMGVVIIGVGQRGRGWCTKKKRHHLNWPARSANWHSALKAPSHCAGRYRCTKKYCSSGTSSSCIPS